MSVSYDTTTEEYIEVIYELEREHRVARVTDIAERRGVTKASVSIILKQLHKKNLINRRQYGHITLTSTGKRLGAKLSRRHDNIKNFLHIIMGVSEDIADEDACKLEHILSSESCNAMRDTVKAAGESTVTLKEFIEQANKQDPEYLKRMRRHIDS